MVTEGYCSFELSKLLKEKGFKQEGCHKSYSMEGPVAPTHQMAMRWLRKIHGLHISAEPYLNNEGEVIWVWEIINIETATIIADSLDGDDFDSCEEAVNAALKYCLTELI